MGMAEMGVRQRGKETHEARDRVDQCRAGGVGVYFLGGLARCLVVLATGTEYDTNG